jgi:hypothetical protein
MSTLFVLSNYYDEPQSPRGPRAPHSALPYPARLVAAADNAPDNGVLIRPLTFNLQLYLISLNSN